MKVADLYGDYIYVSDSQDVDAIKMSIGKSSKVDRYDSFFVLLGEEDFQLVYGMEGEMPFLSKDIYLVYPKQ